MNPRPFHTPNIERAFRDLTRAEIEDPETLEALDTVGFGGTLTWPDLLSSQRLLIVSPAGAGKTFECQQQASQRFAAGDAAFFVTLEGLSGSELPDLLDQAQRQRLGDWMADGHSRACFFLDSIDELQLSHGNFRSALRRLRRAIDGQLHRATIVVTSRPIAIDLQTFASELPMQEPKPTPEVADAGGVRFRQLISGEIRREHHASTQHKNPHDPATGVRIVGLTSLSSDQIGQLIALQRVGDGARLLAEIDRKRAWEFAKRPQELIEICSYWKDHGQLGNRAEHLAEDIRRKLGETGGRNRHLRISEARALEGAERLALAQVLTRKRTIRFSDLSLDDLEREAAIDPSVILDDWSAPEREELLQRPLFGFANYGRVRFHHRSASEYLAACKLQRMCSEGHMPIKALFRLLFGESYGQKLVFPSMRAVAVWLAIRNEATPRRSPCCCRCSVAPTSSRHGSCPPAIHAKIFSKLTPSTWITSAASR
ncbi:MAG: hypothetical protein Q8R44_15600, partial [Novosphingobium sp.]|nr:hypothetical protein [Novosphingobium sp.]